MSTTRKSKVLSVTPEMATRWLEKNTHNRPLRQSTVARYVAAMKAGEWRLTAEAIAFSRPYTDATGKQVDEVLINGQHRLWAVLESGVTCEMTVWWGCEPDEFEVIDQGAGRTFGDVLATTRQDVADPTLVASVCSAFAQFALGFNQHAGALRATHIDCILTSLPDSVKAAVDYKKRLRKFAPRPVISSLMLAHAVNASMADMIVSQLKDAVGFTDRDPIRALHLYVADLISSSTNRDSAAAVNYKTCHAIASRLRGDHIRVLKITGEGLGYMRDGAKAKIQPVVSTLYGRVPHNFYNPKLLMEG